MCESAAAGAGWRSMRPRPRSAASVLRAHGPKIGSTGRRWSSPVAFRACGPVTRSRPACGPRVRLRCGGCGSPQAARNAVRTRSRQFERRGARGTVLREATRPGLGRPVVIGARPATDKRPRNRVPIAPDGPGRSHGRPSPNPGTAHRNGSARGTEGGPQRAAWPPDRDASRAASPSGSPAPISPPSPGVADRR
jgi:hypothetical protein